MVVYFWKHCLRLHHCSHIVVLYICVHFRPLCKIRVGIHFYFVKRKNSSRRNLFWTNQNKLLQLDRILNRNSGILPEPFIRVKVICISTFYEKSWIHTCDFNGAIFHENFVKNNWAMSLVGLFCVHNYQFSVHVSTWRFLLQTFWKELTWWKNNH